MNKTMMATFWVMSGQLTNIITKLASNLILTRLLAPEAFGVMAIANAVFMGVIMMSEVGLRQSIIRKTEDPDRVYLNTVWVIQIIKGILIAGLVILFSALIWVFQEDLSGSYGNVDLPVIIALLALNPFVWGFEPTRSAMASRELSYGLLIRLTIYSQFIGLYFSVYFALDGWGVYSLAFGPLLNIFTRVLFASIFLPGKKNRFEFNWTDAKELFGFGKWVFLTSFLGFVVFYGDKLIMGWFFDEKVLSYFAIASFILGMVRLISNKYSNDIGLPKISSANRTGDIAEVSRIYYKVRLPLDMYSLAASGFLFAAGLVLVDLLYDDRYAKAGEVLSIISIAVAMDRFSMFSSFLLAIDRPKLETLRKVIVSVVLVFGLPISHSLAGEQGVAYFLAAYLFIELPLIIYIKKSYNLLNIGKELAVLVFWPLGYVLGICFIWVSDKFI